MHALALSTSRGSELLHSGFLRSAKATPERVAVEVGRTSMTYAELRDRAAALAATLTARTGDSGSRLTCVFAYRSPVAYMGVLAALMAGRGYVPLSRTLPPKRTRLMLEHSRSRSLVVDRESAEQLYEVLAGMPPVLVVLPEEEEEDEVADLARRLPEHVVLGAADLAPAEAWVPQRTDQEDLAYLLFTSGSTGMPKGVGITHANVRAFIDEVVDRYAITADDRLSQAFELTFDVSVFDMFAAWERGATLCCPSKQTLIKPGRFIAESRLTVWSSVPSIAVFMKRFGDLRPKRYPDLRLSLFAGEALPQSIAESWQEAAPRSEIVNAYGPTEATITCIDYRWHPERSSSECVRGVVPIGHPYPGADVLVVDEKLREVRPGEDGELLLGGSQIARGYWHDHERTAAAFVVPPNRNRRYYRTGDLVRRPVGDRPIVYLGRIDHQIKVSGHRLELGEVEAAIREESGVDEVVAVGWPIELNVAAGIVAFLGAPSVNVERLRARLRERLPYYMVPGKYHVLPTLPVNASGKFDRKALTAMLENRET